MLIEKLELAERACEHLFMDQVGHPVDPWATLNFHLMSMVDALRVLSGDQSAQLEAKMQELRDGS